MKKKRSIVIVEPVSTGFNLIDDVRARGYQPVAVVATMIGTDEDREALHQVKKVFLSRLPEEVPVIDENPNYEEVLEEVQKYDPLLVIAGSEFGVELATRLASDLGLRGNKWANIGKMTRKSEMHQALADYGIRYIRGRIVNSVDEARAFYEELGTSHIVVKPTRGAGTQGVLFCEGLEETLAAVRRLLALAKENEYLSDILIQERIIGKEYIVNTVSSPRLHTREHLLQPALRHRGYGDHPSCRRTLHRGSPSRRFPNDGGQQIASQLIKGIKE